MSRLSDCVVAAALGLLVAACGRTQPYRTPPQPAIEAPDAGSPDASVDLPRTITDDSRGYYNAQLGTVLDGTQPQFPIADVLGGDPTLVPAVQPDLSAANEILGEWLGRQPPPSNGNWTLMAIPPSWARNTETAIVFPIFTETAARLQGSFGVDNGIFIWVNGVYRFGAIAPGGSLPDEYPGLDLGRVPAGLNFVQVLREDHGGGTDSHLKISAVAE